MEELGRTRTTVHRCGNRPTAGNPRFYYLVTISRLASSMNATFVALCIQIAHTAIVRIGCVSGIRSGATHVDSARMLSFSQLLILDQLLKIE